MRYTKRVTTEMILLMLSGTARNAVINTSGIDMARRMKITRLVWSEKLPSNRIIPRNDVTNDRGMKTLLGQIVNFTA